ncbi:MAG: tryptophanase [candidate division WOR-3 bacterium]|nr:MAG: tryptophanase [candidate division WOR-3 bacterium]
MEPYRIKVVEPLLRVSHRVRMRALEGAGFNPFQLPADCVYIDLISDSGTGAMSTQQWAAMTMAREDFSGQHAHQEFVRTAQEIFGLPYVQPVHQGRVAENILFKLLLSPGKVVLGNTHFLTTRENIGAAGGRAIDLPVSSAPFCGDIDLKLLERHLASGSAGLVIMTLTSNIHGGQPVSSDNLQAVRRLARKYRVSLLFDASRFAGNTYLLKELTNAKGSLTTLCRKQFSLCDTAYMSCKKDGLANIGGCILTRSKQLAHELTHEIIRQESFPHAGGLAARDLAAMSAGLQEALDPHFLRSHIESVRYLAARLKEKHVPVFEPVGAHAVTVLPERGGTYAAFAMAAAVFLDSGVRGGVFGTAYRLALPRRVYTRDHLDHVAGAVAKVFRKAPMRLKCTHRPGKFFNFFARFALRH